jgi:hypothetical protein
MKIRIDSIALPILVGVAIASLTATGREDPTRNGAPFRRIWREIAELRE